MPRETVIRVVKEAAGKVLQETDAVVAYLFGSVARGEAHAGSDVDVGIFFRDKPSLKELAAIANDLCEAAGMELDVESLNSADCFFLHDVVAEGIVVYEDDRDERADFEVRVARRYQDMKPHMYEYWRARRERMIGHA